MGICLEKDSLVDWSAAQREIIRLAAPDKPIGNKYFTLPDYNAEIQSPAEQAFVIDYEKVEKKLQTFLGNLYKFEEKLKNS